MNVPRLTTRAFSDDNITRGGDLQPPRLRKMAMMTSQPSALSSPASGARQLSTARCLRKVRPEKSILDSHSMNLHRFSQLQVQRQSREELQRSSSFVAPSKKEWEVHARKSNPRNLKIRTVDDRQIRRSSLPSVQSSLRLDLTSSPPISSHALLAGHNYNYLDQLRKTPSGKDS